MLADSGWWQIQEDVTASRAPHPTPSSPPAILSAPRGGFACRARSPHRSSLLSDCHGPPQTLRHRPLPPPPPTEPGYTPAAARSPPAYLHRCLTPPALAP